MSSEYVLKLETESIDTLNRLFGLNEENLKIIEDSYQIEIICRQEVLIFNNGTLETYESVSSLLKTLLGLCKEGRSFSAGDMLYAISLEKQNQLDELTNFYHHSIAKTIGGKVIYPKTIGQMAYLKALKKNDVVFGIGPAGTGKTYLAVVYAVQALKKNEVKRIILTRPAVEAGESLGFLPGDLKEKVDPYLRPLYDALYDMLGNEQVTKLLEKDVIEIAPLAYMRGRTLDNAFIILDEAQNTTKAQMKMFLTRMGFNSKIVITGDATQIDLVKKKDSGLTQAIDYLKDVEGIGFVELTAHDVVRHPMVQKILECYEKHENE